MPKLLLVPTFRGRTSNSDKRLPRGRSECLGVSQEKWTNLWILNLCKTYCYSINMRYLLVNTSFQVFLCNSKSISRKKSNSEVSSRISISSDYTYTWNTVKWTRREVWQDTQGKRSERTLEVGRWLVSHLYTHFTYYNSMYFFIIWKASNKKIKNLWQRQCYMFTKSHFLRPEYTRSLISQAPLHLG